MCDPVLFDFICSLSSLLFYLIYWNGQAEKLDVDSTWHWGTTVIISESTYAVFFFLLGEKNTFFFADFAG